MKKNIISMLMIGCLGVIMQVYGSANVAVGNLRVPPYWNLMSDIQKDDWVRHYKDLYPRGMAQDQIRALINQLKTLELQIEKAPLGDSTFNLSSESGRTDLLTDVQNRLLQAEEYEKSGVQPIQNRLSQPEEPEQRRGVHYVHGPAMRMLPSKPLTAEQKQEFEKEKKAAEQRYQKEVMAAKKVAIVFPDYTNQCVVLEKNLPFLVRNDSWKKVKSFLFSRAGKEYHRNLTDRGMLINLLIAITNGNGKKQWLVNRSKEWNSFWWDVLRNTTELVYSSGGAFTELD